MILTTAVSVARTPSLRDACSVQPSSPDSSVPSHRRSCSVAVPCKSYPCRYLSVISGRTAPRVTSNSRLALSGPVDIHPGFPGTSSYNIHPAPSRGGGADFAAMPASCSESSLEQTLYALKSSESGSCKPPSKALIGSSQLAARVAAAAAAAGSPSPSGCAPRSSVAAAAGAHLPRHPGVAAGLRAACVVMLPLKTRIGPDARTLAL
eukprot:scaffold129498_cov63-Phaeocystis_antarctica.AAC.1